MSKALILKNMNFSENALTTVSITGGIHCTALFLSESIKAINLSESFHLTATAAPANTTDVLSWSSSNTNIATVSNGIVSPHKPGAVIITATCGSITASCRVTVSAYLDLNLTQTYIIELSTSDNGNAARLSGGTSQNTGTTIITEGEGKYAHNPNSLLSGAHCYPIYLPNGCTGLRVKSSNQNIKISANWCSTTTSNEFGPQYLSCISYTAPWASSIPSGNHVITVPDDTAIDCFYINCYMSGLSQEMLDQITIEAIFN